MGFFDLFRRKKSNLQNIAEEMRAGMFPNGQKDMDAITDALLFVLNNSISRVEAQGIATRSFVLSGVAQDFTAERLKQHYAGYCLHHFNDEEITTFHGYLQFVRIAKTMFGKSPSEVIRQGDKWIIPE
jgi:hypothetical protein